jgi:hypothetical protein
MNRTEMYEFSKQDIKEMKKNYNVKKTEEAIEIWVFRNFDVKHTNGMDYDIDAKDRMVTIIFY